jgi:hypothetical protein
MAKSHWGRNPKIEIMFEKVFGIQMKARPEVAP